MEVFEDLIGPKTGVACLGLAVAAVVANFIVPRTSSRSLGTPEEAAEFIRRARACYFRHASLEGRDYICSEHQLRECLLDLALRPSQALIANLMLGCDSDNDANDRIGIGDFVLFAQLSSQRVPFFEVAELY